MSHRPPLRPRAKAPKLPVNAGALPSAMVRIADAPRVRRLYDSGSMDTDPPRLLSEPGDEYTQVHDTHYTPPDVFRDYTPVMGGLNIGLQVATDASGDAVRQGALDKKRRQWRKWVDEVIPTLVEPYLSLLHQTKSLRLDVPQGSVIERLGDCEHLSRPLQVICVYFESMFSMRF